MPISPPEKAALSLLGLLMVERFIANNGWWMLEFIVDALKVWALLGAEVVLRPRSAPRKPQWRDYHEAAGAGPLWKHVSVFVFCVWKDPLCSLPLVFVLPPSSVLCSPPIFSFLFFLLLFFVLSSCLPAHPLPPAFCPAARGDIISTLPAVVMMWKWRRGKWVAGTSRWCYSLAGLWSPWLHCLCLCAALHKQSNVLQLSLCLVGRLTVWNLRSIRFFFFAKKFLKIQIKIFNVVLQRRWSKCPVREYLQRCYTTGKSYLMLLFYFRATILEGFVNK